MEPSRSVPPGRKGSPSTPRLGRSSTLALGVALVLAGLTLAVLGGSVPTYSVSPLAPSGSFFALAESGNTLYAASDNDGSIFLERSTDQGVTWTASPVPYSLVAGGAPWSYAAVAADGNDLVIAAATAGESCTDCGCGVYGHVVPADLDACASNSSMLIASSADAGATWQVLTFATDNLSVSSLGVQVNGNASAVAWLGETTGCCATTGEVGAVTSSDGGAGWSAPQSLTPAGEVVPTDEGVETAPDGAGIVVAFASTPTNGSTSYLDLLRFVPSGGPAFAPLAALPAPASWTLQGSPTTPAFLLTPAYLIPLGSPPFTAIPFDQLQSDGGGIGELPNVVSLVPVGGSTVEVAATTPDDLGVDCWQIDIATAAVEQTCHVPLVSGFGASSSPLPIVALIDGGGWWIAIGASGANGCTANCPVVPGGSEEGFPPYANGTIAGSAAAPASSSVGTSICLTGCSSASGLVAYSYRPSSAAAATAATAIGAVVALLGLLGIGLSLRRRPDRPRTPPAGTAAASGAAGGLVGVRRDYRRFLAAWTLAWLPLGVAVFFAASPGASVVLPVLVVVGAGLGTLGAFPFLLRARSALESAQDLSLSYLVGGTPVPPRSPEDARTRRMMLAALVSWVFAIGLLVLIGLGVSQGLTVSVSLAGGAVESLPILGVLIAALALGFVGSRAVLHAEAARTVAAYAATSGLPVPEERRIWAGSVLLPLNPFVGLVLAWSLGPIVGGSPYLIAAAFLPVTLLGAALLAGIYGPTPWAALPSASLPTPPVPEAA